MLYKITTTQARQGALLSQLADLTPSDKDLSDCPEVFVVLQQFIDRFNNAEYDKLTSLWYIEDLGSTLYPSAEYIFKVTAQGDNVCIEWGFENYTSVVTLKKDILKSARLHSFSLSNIDAWITLTAENEQQLTFIIDEDQEKYLIKEIRIAPVGE